ncbi:MAG: ion channel [Acidobacteriota bacterium]
MSAMRSKESYANRVDENQDLGFGAVVARESRQRLLNRDGSFNVRRKGIKFLSSVNFYHLLLTMPWWSFFTVVTLFYLGLNAIFALAFLLCGPDALQGPTNDPINNQFLRAFFFSVHTFATIGYGNITPVGLLANIIVMVESLVGLLSFALATGLLFARFSRPTAKIIFSRQAVIAPYHGITAFEFRITNGRHNQLIELEAKVLFTRFENVNGNQVRRFYPLVLERSKVAFFPLSWTIVHPITEESPLYQLTEKDLHSTNAEFLILLTGIDETFSQTVHTRSSYKATEVIWNAKFDNIFNLPAKNDPLTIDVERLHNIEMVVVEVPNGWRKADNG